MRIITVSAEFGTRMKETCQQHFISFDETFSLAQARCAQNDEARLRVIQYTQTQWQNLLSTKEAQRGCQRIPQVKQNIPVASTITHRFHNPHIHSSIQTITFVCNTGRVQIARCPGHARRAVNYCLIGETLNIHCTNFLRYSIRTKGYKSGLVFLRDRT